MVLKDLRWNTHVNHKSYNFLDCDCFKKVLFSTNSLAKLLSDILLSDVWVFDQVCSVKMAAYWPSSFFACLWTETKSRPINSQKKNEANIQPS